MSNETFVETLNVNVTLTSSGESASVNGGNIKELRLDLQLHGFVGRVRIWMVAERGADELFALVTAQELLTIELSVAKSRYNVSQAPEPLQVHGVVTRRGLREIPSADVSGNPVLYREYTLDFADAACALWTQHHPCSVHARTSLKKVIQENTPANVSTSLEWAGLNQTRGIICLGLGQDKASFYDFVFWITDREYGHIWYDYASQKLVFGNAKPSNGSPTTFAAGALEDTRSIQVVLAPRPRQAVNVLNSRDGTTQRFSVTQPTALVGLRHDHLVHTPLNSEAQARQTTEGSRVLTGQFDVHVCCDAYPELYFAPGTLTKLAGEFGDSMFLSGTSLRVLRVNLHANATNQEAEYDIENSTTEYEAQLELCLEPAQDPRWRGPVYKAPHYPLEVEGKVLSAVGQQGDRSYTVYEDEGSSSVYKVQFPLWNTTISIPVTPDFVPGHLYFPVPKDSRVFVSLQFDSARISRYLEWGKDVTVPNASQGNHLLLGQNDTSETSIKHWYVDNSPQLVIGRTHISDIGTVTVKEGTLTLELTEEGGGSGFGATVSVEPQAQIAKAEAAQKSELAVADLQQSSEAAAQELGGSAQSAATALKQQAESLSSEVDAKSKQVTQALTGVSTGVEEQVQNIQDAFSSARQDVEDLLK